MTQQSMKAAIQSVISEMMDGIMDRVLYTDPFKKDEHRAKRPLYAALVPDEIFQGSHFERRFVTPFGNAWEKLAVVAATEGLGYGVTNHQIHGNVKSGRLTRIMEILNRLEHRQKGDRHRTRPDWDNELAYILEGKGEFIPITVICDVFAQNQKTGESYSFELKAPLPNSDQTKVSKEKILKLYCMEPPQITEAYYALPYNPYGKRENYSWSFPARWFNMKEDKVVLIGNEFWEKIGGVGTYRAFIEAVNEIGAEYKNRIYREYLGIEPPLDAFREVLRE
jgi:hypothetical protein